MEGTALGTGFISLEWGLINFVLPSVNLIMSLIVNTAKCINLQISICTFVCFEYNMLFLNVT